MQRIDPPLIHDSHADARTCRLGAANRKRTLLAGAGVFAAGMIAGAALTPRVLAPAPVAIARGDTLVAFAPEKILSLSYTTRTGMTTLQRSTRGTRFHIQSTFADERPAQRCTAAADLGGYLHKLAELKAQRGLTREQRVRNFPVQLGVLDIRDSHRGEPPVSLGILSNQDQSSLAVTLEGYAGEVALPVAELKWLERACDTVALRNDEHAPDDKPASIGQAFADP